MKCWGTCRETDRLEKEALIYEKALKLAIIDANYNAPMGVIEAEISKYIERAKQDLNGK